ncbi:hypothetical protein L873DRAFT_1787261 [Choiromyces venosus 120613-1]|uniref:Uncharacterized protein n=1 Tax=Choiromyces venosus 120613-1 TaxID=1336337 RepID=A0A3N4JY19_9PEZI|nr:hypothetical protein L873DRAFT_1787261 [Choiromyces venosus 120613-1]
MQKCTNQSYHSKKLGGKTPGLADIPLTFFDPQPICDRQPFHDLQVFHDTQLFHQHEPLRNLIKRYKTMLKEKKARDMKIMKLVAKIAILNQKVDALEARKKHS